MWADRGSTSRLKCSSLRTDIAKQDQSPDRSPAVDFDGGLRASAGALVRQSGAGRRSTVKSPPDAREKAPNQGFKECSPVLSRPR